MKNNKLMKTAAVVGALALMAGGVVVADAASDKLAGKGLQDGSGQGYGRMANLTTEEKTAWEAERETRQAEMETKRTAAQAAIASGSYEDWKLAVGEDHPFVSKINAENFSRFVEAHQNLEEARAIFAELGLEGAPGMGGMGKGEGRGHGMGLGMGMGGGRLLNQ